MRKRIMPFVIALSLLALPLSFAQTGTSAPDPNPKLDKILQNQQQILKELSEIKEELLIIKVRATE